MAKETPVATTHETHASPTPVNETAAPAKTRKPRSASTPKPIFAVIHNFLVLGR